MSNPTELPDLDRLEALMQSLSCGYGRARSEQIKVAIRTLFARRAQPEVETPTNTEIARVILRLIGECVMDWHAGDPDDAFSSDDEELRLLVDLVNKARAAQLDGGQGDDNG